MIVHLIDGTYELYRQHFGAPSRDGSPNAATIGALQSTLRLIQDGATHVAVATDHVIESFRNARRATSGGEGRALDSTAPSWKVLLPDAMPLRAEVLHQMSMRHELPRNKAKHIAAAFGVGNAEFDAAMTIHVAMNIARKDRVYAEARRVLKPGARFAVYDVLQGEGGDVLYPVPWAREPSISHLATPDAMQSLLV